MPGTEIYLYSQMDHLSLLFLYYMGGRHWFLPVWIPLAAVMANRCGIAMSPVEPILWTLRCKRQAKTPPSGSSLSPPAPGTCALALSFAGSGWSAIRVLCLGLSHLEDFW